MLQGLQEIHTILFILALCFFPLGPIPVRPLWILAGLRFGPTAAILISFVCLLVNFAIAYMLSAVLMRGLIKKIILKHVKKMPNIQRSQQLSFTTIVRLVPGTPLAIQNYLLGFLRIKPLIYFMVSVPIQMLYAVGFIIFGRSIIEGKAGQIILSCSLLIAITLGIKTFSIRLNRDNKKKLPAK